MLNLTSRSRKASSLLAMTSILATLTLVGSGCGEKKPETKEPPKVEKKVETPPKVEKKPEVDPLEEAKKDAKQKAQDLVITMMDQGTAIAGYIEGLKTATTTTKTRIKTSKPEKAKGRIDPKAASKVFRDYNGAMRKCYERALKKSPGLEGRVSLSLLVNTDGSVKRASARGLNSEVTGCMSRISKQMKFPKPKGGLAKINKPYEFEPDT